VALVEAEHRLDARPRGERAGREQGPDAGVELLRLLLAPGERDVDAVHHQGDEERVAHAVGGEGRPAQVEVREHGDEAPEVHEEEAGDVAHTPARVAPPRHERQRR